MVEQRQDTKKIFVLGALGAGKSTALNIISAASGLSKSSQKFAASNQLTGCTQEFEYDVIPLPNGEQIRLIDSPGLADPNILIDMWVCLYNSAIASQKWGIDLVVVVIEYAERPSSKEFQVFAVLNQALAAIKCENLVVLFNKCPDEIEADDARVYYEACCESIRTENKFPQLKDDNFLVLRRVGNVSRKLKDAALLNAQLQVNKLLQEVVCDFVFKSLGKVKNQVLANEADRTKLADSFMDDETREEIKKQNKQFEESRDTYEAIIKQHDEKAYEIRRLMAEKELQQRQVIDNMKESLKQQEIDHQNALRDACNKTQAELAELIKKDKEMKEKLQKQLQVELDRIDVKQNKIFSIFAKIVGTVCIAGGIIIAPITTIGVDVGTDLLKVSFALDQQVKIQEDAEQERQNK